MKLTAQQEMHLRNVIAADERWRNAQKDALDRAKIIAAQEVASYLADRDKEVRLAFEAGIPKVQIRERGLKTTSPKTLNDSLARTTEQAALTELAGIATDPLAGRYSIDTEYGTLTITLDGLALETACAEADWSVADAIGAGVTSAMFGVNERVGDGSKYLTALTPAFLPEHGNVHPVVQWARQTENESEALTWARQKVAT